MVVEIDEDIRVRAQDRCRSEGADFAVKTFLDRLRFACVGNNTENFLGFENLGTGHRDGATGHLLQALEPALAQLLTPASIIEIDHQERFRGSKIGWRIVEGQVSILPDADEGDVNRSFADLSRNLGNGLLRISVALEEVIVDDSNFVEQALAKIFLKAGRVIARQADVFVQMKHLDIFPVHSGNLCELVE